MRPETLAHQVIQSRIKLPLSQAILADMSVSSKPMMLIQSAYEAVVEAIKLDRLSRKKKGKTR